jgi:hypothetical protein
MSPRPKSPSTDVTLLERARSVRRRPARPDTAVEENGFGRGLAVAVALSVLLWALLTGIALLVYFMVA